MSNLPQTCGPDCPDYVSEFKTDEVCNSHSFCSYSPGQRYLVNLGDPCIHEQLEEDSPLIKRIKIKELVKIAV